MAKEVNKFNDRVAATVTAATGNMWFFWLALAFIIILRVSQPPTTSQLLLDIENDLQLLLLAANAVISAKQSNALKRILHHIGAEAETIEKIEEKKLT